MRTLALLQLNSFAQKILPVKHWLNYSYYFKKDQVSIFYLWINCILPENWYKLNCFFLRVENYTLDLGKDLSCNKPLFFIQGQFSLVYGIGVKIVAPSFVGSASSSASTLRHPVFHDIGLDLVITIYGWYWQTLLLYYLLYK